MGKRGVYFKLNDAVINYLANDSERNLSIVMSEFSNAFSGLFAAATKKTFNREDFLHEEVYDKSLFKFLEIIKEKKIDTSKAKPSTFLIRIVRNKFIDEYRRKGSYKELKSKNFSDFGDSGFDEHFSSMGDENTLGIVINSNKRKKNDPKRQLEISPEQMELIRAVFKKAQIRPSEATCFILKISDYMYKEISQQLDIPIGTVKANIFKVKEKLGKMLESLNDREKDQLAALLSPNETYFQNSEPNSKIIFEDLSSMRIENNPFVDL